MRISNSFSEGEVQILDFILNTLLRGGTPTTATRHRDFASVYRKVLTMKKRIEQQEQKRQGTETSSVGNVEAAPAQASEGDPAEETGASDETEQHKEAV